MYWNKQVFLSKETLKRNGFESEGYHGRLMYIKPNTTTIDVIIAKPTEIQKGLYEENEAYLRVNEFSHIEKKGKGVKEIMPGLKEGIQLSLADEFIAKTYLDKIKKTQ